MPKRTQNKFGAFKQRLHVWFAKYSDTETVRQAEALPFRRDMVTLLMYVRDDKVVGTQGAGNMPLKAVREVTSRFVKPPKLEATIGDHICRIRSEADLWALYFPRVLAEVGGLLKIAPARRWRLTHRGKEFLEAPSMLQITYLLTTWWYMVNWLFAYPFTGMGDDLPPHFNLFTLDGLLALPVETHTSFVDFADELIEKTGLTWGAPDPRVATTALRDSIARMVIHILAAFGAIEREYRDEPIGKGTTSMLDAFEITPFGNALLEAVALMHE